MTSFIRASEPAILSSLTEEQKTIFENSRMLYEYLLSEKMFELLSEKQAQDLTKGDIRKVTHDSILQAVEMHWSEERQTNLENYLGWHVFSWDGLTDFDISAFEQGEEDWYNGVVEGPTSGPFMPITDDMWADVPTSTKPATESTAKPERRPAKKPVTRLLSEQQHIAITTLIHQVEPYVSNKFNKEQGAILANSQTVYNYLLSERIFKGLKKKQNNPFTKKEIRDIVESCMKKAVELNWSAEQQQRFEDIAGWKVFSSEGKSEFGISAFEEGFPILNFFPEPLLTEEEHIALTTIIHQVEQPIVKEYTNEQLAILERSTRLYDYVLSEKMFEALSDKLRVRLTKPEVRDIVKATMDRVIELDWSEERQVEFANMVGWEIFSHLDQSEFDITPFENGQPTWGLAEITPTFASPFSPMDDQHWKEYAAEHKGDWFPKTFDQIHNELKDWFAPVEEDEGKSKAVETAQGVSQELLQVLGATMQQIAEDGTTLENVSTEEILARNDVVGLLFSTTWCRACRAFTQKLKKVVPSLQENGIKFEPIWFNSIDKPEDALRYMQANSSKRNPAYPWAAHPLDAIPERQEILKHFNVRALPTLLLVDTKTGEVLTEQGFPALSGKVSATGERFPTPKFTLKQIAENFPFNHPAEDVDRV